MTENILYTVYPDRILIVADSSFYVINEDDPNYLRILAAIKDDYLADVLYCLVHRKKEPAAISCASSKNWKVIPEENTVCYKGMPVTGSFADLILLLNRKKLLYQHLMRFYEKAQLNQSHFSTKLLWDFVRVYGIPVTQNGSLLMYTIDHCSINAKSSYFRVGRLKCVRSIAGSDIDKIVFCEVEPFDVEEILFGEACLYVNQFKILCRGVAEAPQLSWGYNETRTQK